ncbi:MAG TPA: ATP-binding protein [Actinomycetota bacterium]
MAARAHELPPHQAPGRSPALAPAPAVSLGRRAAGFSMALAGNVALTLLLLLVRDRTTPLSKGFAFMAVVIAAAALGGLGPGVAASVVGFALFNFFFLPPYGTMVVGRLEDVVVLFVFLGLSLVISALLARQAERAGTAEARERELEMLQDLNRELVTGPPGTQTYEAALSHLVGLFGFEAASLLVARDGVSALREAVAVGAPLGTIHPSWDPQRRRSPIRMPLHVGRRTLGLVVLAGDRPAPNEPESRVLRAFCDELALVLERDRLLALAQTAETYKRTDQARRSLLGAVSHELRTPLAAIKASVTDLLARDAPSDARYRREALETVNEEADRLDGLIANLLDMSRVEAGSLTAHLQASDLAEALRRCADRTERIWPQLRVHPTVDSSAAFVRADPVFLDRVVTNLLENAAKAAPEGSGHVEMEARCDNGRVTVRVIDHGRGVPADARERIFQPFSELDGAGSPGGRLGTGLGLAICKGFLAAMNGEVWIEDTPGGGATFAFSLPGA